MMGKVKIEVSQEVRNKIMKAFCVTSKSVSNALNYTGERGQTDLAKRIRRMAMENGGRRMAYWPECETIHDEGTGEMVQTFNNGAVLTIDKSTGNAKVDYRGRTCLLQEDISVKQLYVLQEYAAAFKQLP
ncbi:MAG: hypothetical protein IJQ13_04165 [Prevotella sp.]|nr:hypothetical protein [Prevotella sp.]